LRSASPVPDQLSVLLINDEGSDEAIYQVHHSPVSDVNAELVSEPIVRYIVEVGFHVQFDRIRVTFLSDAVYFRNCVGCAASFQVGIGVWAPRVLRQVCHYSNVANKKLLKSFESQPIIATKLCSTGDLNDFKENDRFRLTDVGDLLPVGADGEIKDGGVTEEAAKNQLETYGKRFVLTRKMIINDDLGAFMKVPVAMGNRAARLIDQLFFSRLLKNPVQLDGKPLFSAAHKNLLTGATSALSSDSLKKAIQLFLDQVDADGQPISVEPKFLLVPTALKHLAIELTRGATLITAGGADNVVRPALNILADENLQVVSSPYLANAAYDGASSTAWYLFGDPRQVDTWEIGYLKGKRTPTVERGETDFNTLGLWFRVYFDLGVREQEHRGMVKSAGAAG